MSEKTKTQNQNKKKPRNRKNKNGGQKGPPTGNNKKKNKNKNQKIQKTFRPVINNRFARAQGSRANIMVPANANASAVQAAMMGPVGQAYARGYLRTTTDPIYWAYLAGTQDILSIMAQKISDATGRLEYINEILGSYQPKSVPFRGVGEIAYHWDGLDAVAPTNVVTVRMYGTYMWVDSGINVGDWSESQVAPPAPPTVSDSTAALAKLYNLLSDAKIVGQRYCQSVELGTTFIKDVSGFASVLNYYGAGNSTTTGPASSSECEVPFKSIILAIMSSFVANGTRVSRFLKFGSGDSTCAFGLGSLPGFKQEWYRTAFAPIYKFIDLQELTYSLTAWFQALCSKAATQWPTGPAADIAYVFATFPFTARQFAVMVRQCIMAIFNDTQACAQFLRPSDTPNGFEGLRCGSNCYGKGLNSNISVPSIVRENIVNLFYSVYEVSDRYHNDKNAQIIIPVWGVFTTSNDINPTVEQWDPITEAWVLGPMFQPSDVLDPNLVDCVNAGGDVIDVNESNLLIAMINDWNSRINALKGFSLPLSYLGGSTGNGNLLYFTRLYEYRAVDFTPNVYNQAALKKIKNNDLVVRKPLVRKDSKDRRPDYEEITLPPGTGLATARPVSYTSIAEITSTFEQAIPYMILPFIPLEDGVPPSQNQWRTTGLEAKLLAVGVDIDGPYNTRLAQIQVAAEAWAPGIAGSETDEFSGVIAAMNGQDKGGFFGDLIGGVLTMGAKALGNAIPI